MKSKISVLTIILIIVSAFLILSVSVSYSAYKEKKTECLEYSSPQEIGNYITCLTMRFMYFYRLEGMLLLSSVSILVTALSWKMDKLKKKKH